MTELHVKSKTFNQKDTLVLEDTEVKKLETKIYRHELWLGTSSTYTGEKGQMFIYSKQTAKEFFGHEVGSTFSLSGIGLDWCNKIIDNAVDRKIGFGGGYLINARIYWSIGSSNFHRVLYEYDPDTGLVSKTDNTIVSARVISSIEV